jgi:GNAT superfamily N-acetyltransferase
MAIPGTQPISPLQFPADIEQAFAGQRMRSKAAADAIALEYGSAAAYRASLRLHAIRTQADPLLPAFYKLYTQIFTLADEREPLEGFLSVLGLNDDAGVQRDFGPLREPILVASDPHGGEAVAAVNFTLYAYPGSVYAFDASCQIHFLMVRADRRGLGIGGYLIGEVEKAIRAFSKTHCGLEQPRFFITCEQNNPARMTRDEILADAHSALIHPYVRMDWWRRRGFKLLDFDYIHPPLSPAHSPCRYLNYYACPSDSMPGTMASIPSDVLIEHLRRFFFVSVGKLAFDMDANPQWQAIRLALQKAGSIALV